VLAGHDVVDLLLLLDLAELDDEEPRLFLVDEGDGVALVLVEDVEERSQVRAPAQVDALGDDDGERPDLPEPARRRAEDRQATAPRTLVEEDPDPSRLSVEGCAGRRFEIGRQLADEVLEGDLVGPADLPVGAEVEVDAQDEVTGVERQELGELGSAFHGGLHHRRSARVRSGTGGLARGAPGGRTEVLDHGVADPAIPVPSPSSSVAGWGSGPRRK